MSRTQTEDRPSVPVRSLLLGPIWRGLVLAAAGAMWFFVGSSGDRPLMQPIMIIMAIGLSAAVVLIVSTDVAENTALRQDVSSALRTMESMRRTSSDLIRHTPPGGTRRVVVPETLPKSISGQSTPVSGDAARRRPIKLPPIKPKLDLFKGFGSWKIREPGEWPCGNQPQKNLESSGSGG